jgi:hypothetical protein
MIIMSFILVSSLVLCRVMKELEGISRMLFNASNDSTLEGQVPRGLQ